MKTEWHTEYGKLCVRFDGMKPSHFQQILQQFKNEFPDAAWNSQIRFWLLSINDIQRVALFSFRYFGGDSMVYSGKSKPPQQPLLF